ncbi:hypothetical protein NQ314_000112 [Rhamnusium bicolor]|uniref:Growth hormone-inducible transmembrane protein n=1 Tax=Rhamnusium bicolor TaxID=1586634 RepID=A0AAV8ZVQ7_9CUCU|nr:hypothetical protein NQ314_000112 [Rhamnusium bicolor]
MNQRALKPCAAQSVAPLQIKMALMLASRLCRAPTLQKSALKQFQTVNVYRTFADEGRDAMARSARRRTTLKEKIMAPAGDTAFNIGKGAVAGGAIIGVGALCYYGLGLGKDVGAIDHQHLWPEYVKDRIKTTYLYFGGSGFAMSLAAIMGTGILCQSIEYKEGFGAKQMAWLLHTGTMGAILAPMCFLGGPLLIRAAWYTAGVVGGLSTIAVCAPSEQFLYMGGPLAMGLGVVFASSVGSMFLPPTTALGAGLYSISLYGGLLLFSAFLLHDTQRIVAQAERHPASPELYGVKRYDPINA